MWEEELKERVNRRNFGQRTKMRLEWPVRKSQKKQWRSIITVRDSKSHETPGTNLAKSLKVKNSLERQNMKFIIDIRSVSQCVEIRVDEFFDYIFLTSSGPQVPILVRILICDVKSDSLYFPRSVNFFLSFFLLCRFLSFFFFMIDVLFFLTLNSRIRYGYGT